MYLSNPSNYPRILIANYFQEMDGLTIFLGGNNSIGLDDAKFFTPNRPNLDDVSDRDDEELFLPTETEDSKNEEEEVIKRSWIGLSERQKVSEFVLIIIAAVRIFALSCCAGERKFFIFMPILHAKL